MVSQQMTSGEGRADRREYVAGRSKERTRALEDEFTKDFYASLSAGVLT